MQLKESLKGKLKMKDDIITLNTPSIEGISKIGSAVFEIWVNHFTSIQITGPSESDAKFLNSFLEKFKPIHACIAAYLEKNYKLVMNTDNMIFITAQAEQAETLVDKDHDYSDEIYELSDGLNFAHLCDYFKNRDNWVRNN